MGQFAAREVLAGTEPCPARQMAAFTLASNTFGAVPEPSGRALMIIGFGLVGVSLRTRTTGREDVAA